MGRLYPPYIDSKLPGQQGNTIRIPYVHNRSVHPDEVRGFSLYVKTLSGQQVLERELIIKPEGNNAIFAIPEENKLREGQYYKAQIAYINKNNEIGYWSDAGVFKYVSPNIECRFDEEYFNTLTYEFNGIYNYRADLSEKPKYYCFTLYEDQKGTKVLETSGKQLYNSANDVEPGESHHSWVCTRARNEIDGGFIQYEVETVSGLIVKTGVKPMEIQITELEVDKYLQSLHKLLIAENNYEEGCIDLKCRSGDASSLCGSFVIERADSRSNFMDWTLISRVDIEHNFSEGVCLMWRDYTVEQGVSYRYAIQRTIQTKDGPDWCEIEYFMNDINGQWEDYVTADFEDIFLADLGNKNNELKQLKIRYNPKVSLFKPTILESKTDTIGGQYPFVFRNGDVRYYEFGLSGLISYLGDNEGLFAKRETLGYVGKSANNGGLNELAGQLRSRTKETKKLPRSAHTNLTTDNFVTERDFRNQVISWLTDGKPKLLRTPAEGNFIVRLMNVSLSPNEQLSRMLYSFSCSAFEIAECNTRNLIKYGLLATPDVQPGEFYDEQPVEIVRVLNHEETVMGVLVRNEQVGAVYADLLFENESRMKIKRPGLPYEEIANVSFINEYVDYLELLEENSVSEEHCFIHTLKRS